jgi:N-acetylglucosamine kinase-like BadF-type ATPase
MFSSDDSGLPDNAGGTGDASIGSDIGSVAAPVADLLSSSDSGRQATRMASTLGDTVRFDPRRVRIPVLPIEDQRTHGAAFRRLADLARTLRAAHDEGNALIHDLIDATVSSISAAPELQR